MHKYGNLPPRPVSYGEPRLIRCRIEIQDGFSIDVSKILHSAVNNENGRIGLILQIEEIKIEDSCYIDIIVSLDHGKTIQDSVLGYNLSFAAYRFSVPFIARLTKVQEVAS